MTESHLTSAPSLCRLAGRSLRLTALVTLGVIAITALLFSSSLPDTPFPLPTWRWSAAFTAVLVTLAASLGVLSRYLPVLAHCLEEAEHGESDKREAHRQGRRGQRALTTLSAPATLWARRIASSRPTIAVGLATALGLLALCLMVQPLSQPLQTHALERLALAELPNAAALGRQDALFLLLFVLTVATAGTVGLLLGLFGGLCALCVMGYFPQTTSSTAS